MNTDNLRNSSDLAPLTPRPRLASVKGFKVLLSLALFAAGQAAAVRAQNAAPGTITLQSLVQRMVNRDALAEYPAYAVSTGEVTSKDPRARTQYFYADDDGGNFQRDIVVSGRTEHVMLDASGPGALTRFFIAGPAFTGPLTCTEPCSTTRTLRVYLDGNLTAPVLTSNLNTLMTGGDFVGAPFVYAAGPNPIKTPYSGTVPPGLNLYLPIPFANQILVTYDGPANVTPTNQPYPILDFVWEYVRYAYGTQVTSFTPAQYTDNKTALAPYADQLSATSIQSPLPGTAAYTNQGGATTFFNQNLGAGQSVTYTLPAGAHALRQLQANVGTSSAALAGAQLTLKFDSDASSVDAPVGNFFGSGEGLHVGTTQMQSVGSDGTMTERWTMPWQSSASITVRNTTGATISLFLSGVVGSYTWDADSMHFHAYRRINGPMVMSDITHTMRMMNILGKGVLVGDQQTVVEAQPNGDSASNWWGEGDELIYVDGSAFPAHRGTGSEDYFGYAFSHVYPFQSPWTSQTSVAPQTNPPNYSYDGTTVLNRNRLLDVIPFQDHLQYDFEIHNNNDPESVVEVDHTTFFYALPGTVSLVPDGPVSGKSYTVESKINGWSLTAASATSVTTDLKHMNAAQQWVATSVGTDSYKLQNVDTGTYLTTNAAGSGELLGVAAYDANQCAQQWKILNFSETTTLIPDAAGTGFNGYQSLVNNCGFAADVVDGATAAGTPVQQFTHTGSDSQYWRFNLFNGDTPRIPDGIYTINNLADNLNIDVPNASPVRNTVLQLYQNDGKGGQQWTMNYQGDGTYSIRNVATGQALDNSGTGAGTPVDQYPWTGGSNMTWRIIPEGPNQFQIQNVSNGLALSIGAVVNGVQQISQQSFGSGTGQLWNFTFVPGT